MQNSVRNLAAATLALVVLLVAGCQRGGAPGVSPGVAGSSPAAPTAAAPVKNVVTPETAGRPTLELRFGEPVVFEKGGITLTITAKSLEKLDGDPVDGTDLVQEQGCGVWWKLTDEIVVDAQPNAAWQGWAVDLSGFGGLQQGARGGGYDRIPVVDSGTGPDRFINVTLPAEGERRAHPNEPFHKVLVSKRYFGMCTDRDSHQPSGLEPSGADIILSNVYEGGRDTKIARWLL